MRKSGVLLPVASLPGPYGIGCFGKEAYDFVDMLKKAGQSYWQILPLGPTGYGDSPYQSFSTFAGNPYFIDLKSLIAEELLTNEECEAINFGQKASEIDYAKIYEGRFPILKKAYARAKNAGFMDLADYQDFRKRESGWLADYALFMAIKDRHGGKSWDQWEENIRLRNKAVLDCYRQVLREEVSFYEFLQYLFQKQWTALKTYANQNGIQIIGDIPIYVAFDSADTWANPELFAFDEKNQPTAVAGCPPDGFSATGQLWGNPLYRWDYHKSTGFDWWVRRIAACLGLYDLVRIDHFRGFDEYYSIPYGDKTAEHGRWMPGPGMALFDAVRENLGEAPIIAEDLGFLTDTVKQLLTDSGFPGMKVIQFAFDSREESDYLPHNYGRNCVVYTGTHDNDTLAGWCASLDETDKALAFDYINRDCLQTGKVHWDFICLAMRSVADTCIIPAQDYLGLGSKARINTPSTLGGNWTWRLEDGAFTEEIIRKMRRVTQVTGRLQP